MAAPDRHDLPVELGNAGDVPTNGTGWFVGWSDWAHAPFDLRWQPADAASTDLCIKWYRHADGHPHGEIKPLSTGRTISILVGEAGAFRLDFSRSPAFEPGATLVHVLRRPGKSERAELDAVIERAADAVEMIVRDGVEAAMGLYNQMPDVTE